MNKVKIRNTPIVHEVLYCSRFIGLRNRLRCPSCKSVGTFKMHGGTLDALCDRIEDYRSRKTEIRRTTRRWICKYCGYYEGPEGIIQAWPDQERGVWRLPKPYDPESPEPGPTPKEVIEEHLNKTWPWRG